MILLSNSNFRKSGFVGVFNFSSAGDFPLFKKKLSILPKNEK